MSNERYDIAVIGGGASGMMAALCAKKTNASLRVALFERQARVGRKLLATGNGRCNLTNARALDQKYYHGTTSMAREALTRFPPEEVLRRFADMGLDALPDGEGRYYPRSDQAAAVVDVLRFSLAEAGVDVVPGFEVARLEAGFFFAAMDGRTARSSRVIVCCGGPAGEKLGGSRAGHRLLESLGHPITPLYPSLSQIKTPAEMVRALKGVKFRGEIALIEDDRAVQVEAGEVLFAEYGLTGIAAMALSRRAAMALKQGRRTQVRLHMLSLDRSVLESRQRALASRPVGDFLVGLLPRRLGDVVLKQAGLSPARLSSSITIQEMDALRARLEGWTLPVLGVQGFDCAQVTAGGAQFHRFDPATLESRIVPGLYAAGEVLDVDGDCGGFNLQWAWASGMLSGECAALSL